MGLENRPWPRGLIFPFFQKKGSKISVDSESRLFNAFNVVESGPEIPCISMASLRWCDAPFAETIPFFKL